MAIVVIATMVVVTMTIMAVSGGDDGYDYCYDDDGGDGDNGGSGYDVDDDGSCYGGGDCYDDNGESGYDADGVNNSDNGESGYDVDGGGKIWICCSKFNCALFDRWDLRDDVRGERKMNRMKIVQMETSIPFTCL